MMDVRVTVGVIAFVGMLLIAADDYGLYARPLAWLRRISRRQRAWLRRTAHRSLAMARAWGSVLVCCALLIVVIPFENWRARVARRRLFIVRSGFAPGWRHFKVR